MATTENPATADTVGGVLDNVQAPALNNRDNSPLPDNWQRLGDASAAVVPQLRVELHADGSFDYAEDGVLASILPVRGLGGRMEDIVAWVAADPARWWLRRRMVVILGMEAVETADYMREPLLLFDTPLDWLKAGKRGAVILSWDAHLPFYLPEHAPLHCASNRLAKRLRDALTQPNPIREIRGPDRWQK